MPTRPIYVYDFAWDNDSDESESLGVWDEGRCIEAVVLLLVNPNGDPKDPDDTEHTGNYLLITDVREQFVASGDGDYVIDHENNVLEGAEAVAYLGGAQ